MSAGWLIAREESGAVPLPHHGRALLFAQFHLEEWTREAGLSPLKEFLSHDPAALAQYFSDQGIDSAEYDLPEEEWFDPSDAQPTLRYLVNRLNADPGPVQNFEKVRDDLQALLDVVTAADETGERFHIAAAMPDLAGREPGAKPHP